MISASLFQGGAKQLQFILMSEENSKSSVNSAENLTCEFCVYCSRELEDERERFEHDRVVGETRVTELVSRLTSVLGMESRETEILVNRVSIKYEVC